MAATNAGMILGTAAYMSPEQAKGMTLDRKTDIFAFGAVLYEMLTGRQAFQGDTGTEILAAVLKVEPDWTLLPNDTPEAIRRLLRRCLQKEQSRRLQTAGDARIEIEEARPAAKEPAAPSTTFRSRERLAWISALAFVTLIAGVFGVSAFRREPAAPAAPEMRLDIITPPSLNLVSLAVSPDGQKIVFVADSGGSKLWLRSLDSVSARPLPGMGQPHSSIKLVVRNFKRGGRWIHVA